MFYRINKEDGYIHGIVSGVNFENSNATEEEYNNIKKILENVPASSDSFYYRLKENLEWELCEFKIVDEDSDFNEATIADYQDALREVGVDI